VITSKNNDDIHTEKNECYRGENSSLICEEIKISSAELFGVSTEIFGIPEKRELIKQEFFQRQNILEIHSLCGEHLRYIFERYEFHYFKERITNLLKKYGDTLLFKISKGKKDQHIAGWCKTQKKGDSFLYTINLAAGLFFNLDVNKNKPLVNGGVTCYDKFTCLQVTFEHELIHLLVRLIYRNSTFGVRAHGVEFKIFAFDYFRHTDIRHRLSGTTRSLPNPNLKEGDAVSIKYKEEINYGIVQKIMPVNVGVFLENGKKIRCHPSLCEKTTRSVVIPKTSERNHQLHIGDRVKLTFRKNVVYGTIDKILKINVSIKLDNGFCVRGHPSLCQKI
jgi:hypothetical protein